MIICRKCGCPVDETPSTPDYSYYCPQCDEDLYSFETEEVEDWADDRNIRFAIYCFKKEKNREPKKRELDLLIDIAVTSDSYYDIETDVNRLFNN